MRPRFRGSGRGAVSFFAFQDVITSVIGIVIVVVLLMALDLSRVAATGGGDEFDSITLRRQLQTLLADLADRRLWLKEHFSSAAATDGQAVVLETQLKELREEVASLHAQKQRREAELRRLIANDDSIATRAQLDEKRAAVATALRNTGELEKEVSQGAEAMADAEQRLRAAEAALLAEAAKKNQISLIPDLPKSSKEPIVAVVSTDKVTWQRFDHPDANVVSERPLDKSLSKYLKRYSPLDQYVVFYFKPSGIGNFEALTSAAKRAGFDIGYDAIAEDVEINFRPVK